MAKPKGVEGNSNAKSTYWTVPGRLETLTKHWKEGKSASQIVHLMDDGCTRAMICGKIHRLKAAEKGEMVLGGTARRTLGKTTKPIPPPKPARLGVAGNGAVFQKAPNGPEPITLADEGPGSATVLTLAEHMCRWPIGDPSNDAFTMCGKSAVGKPYCEGHMQRAYQPPKDKRPHSAKELARSLRRYL